MEGDRSVTIAPCGGAGLTRIAADDGVPNENQGIFGGRGFQNLLRFSRITD